MAQQPFEFVAAEDGTLDDEAVIERAPGLPVDQLLELLGAYERLGKKQMSRLLADEILKKDPANAQALRVKEGKPMLSTLQGESTEADRFGAQIDSLRNQKRYREAVDLLLARKREGDGGAFAFQEDLAYTYQLAGNTAAARSAYRELASGDSYPAAERASARRALADMEKSDKFAEATRLLERKDPEGAMEIAEALLAASPGDPDARALKAICLSESGQHDEALAILQEMKANHRGGKFPYDVDIAGVLLAAKRYDEAEAMYRAMGGAAGAGGLRQLEKSRSIETAYGHIARGRGDEALAAAEALRAQWPKDPDVVVLHGEALLAAGRPGEAAAELIAAKDQYFKDAPFPGQGDLGMALYRTSDFAGARAAYDELLAAASFYTQAERDDALVQRRSINDELSAVLKTDGQWVSEDEGEAYHVTVYSHTALRDGWRYWGWGRVDSIDLSSDSPLDIDGGERYEGGIAIERRTDKWDAALRLGGSDDDVLAGLQLRRELGHGTSVYLEGAYNERAEDSLTLEALDGRQHRVEIGVERQLAPRLYLEAAAYARWLDVLDDNIGRGWGGYANLDYTLVEALGARPALRVGYAGEVHIFDGDPLGARFDRYTRPGTTAAERAALIDDIVEPEINLHGIRGIIEGRLGPGFAYFLTGAIQYDFYDREIQYSAGIGLERFFTDTISLTAGVEYYSAGQASSGDSGVVVGNIGLAVRF